MLVMRAVCRALSALEMDNFCKAYFYDLSVVFDEFWAIIWFLCTSFFVYYLLRCWATGTSTALRLLLNSFFFMIDLMKFSLVYIAFASLLSKTAFLRLRMNFKTKASRFWPNSIKIVLVSFIFFYALSDLSLCKLAFCLISSVMPLAFSFSEFIAVLFLFKI